MSRKNKQTVIRGNPDHPVSRGFICFRGKHFSHIHHDPRRLTRPLLKRGNRWQEIPFEHALDVFAEKLMRSKERFGAESVVFYKGEALKHQQNAAYMRHLAYGFGSPNYVSVGSLCHYAMVMGHALTYGGIPKPDFNRIKSAIIWGANPAASSPRLFQELKGAVKSGLNLLVIDPAGTRTARLAAMHLSIRPGTDGLLALSFIKHAMEHVDIDAELTGGKGWDAFKQMAEGLSLNDLLRKCDVSRDAYQRASSLIFNNRPVWTLTGLGLELQPGGVQAIRAAACLQSILDPENRPSPFHAPLNPLPGTELYHAMPDPVGANKWPLFTKRFQEGQGMGLHRAILKNDPYPVRGMFLAGGNPMLTFPASRIQQEALASLEFLAVFDLFMTPTAQLADLVFPAADHLDMHELHDYGSSGEPYVGLIQPRTRESIGRSLWEILFGVARRLGLEHLFPWQNNREAVSYRLSGTGITLGNLEKSSSAVSSYTPVKNPNGAWNTPDGCVQYDIDAIGALGRTGLPEPCTMQLPASTDDQYPLWLSTGDRLNVYHHSQFRGSAKHRAIISGPFLEIHPHTAKRCRIAAGDPVVVSTRDGSLHTHAKLNSDLRTDAVRMVHGWEEANVNELTGVKHFDPISGFPWLRAMPVRIEKMRC